jgi:branched-chain amino acid transport system ATP-binding protein
LDTLKILEVGNKRLMSSILTVNNLSMSFRGIQALTEVSFEVDKGEILSIIGPNGALAGGIKGAGP